MRRKAGGTALLLVLVFVCGCGGVDDETDPRPDGTATPARSEQPAPSAPVPPSATTPSATTPDRASALVTLTESGGIDGRHHSIVVYDDGTYLLVAPGKRNRPGRMAPAALAELRTALDEVDFSRLPTRPTGPPVMDGLTRVLVHDGRTSVDDGTDIPADLAAVYDALPPLS
ncbi:hypothetical protein QMZ92_29020 [Streptomyces sp. HNM0645]|uniref:hypothetical protein n=1 Tax=Streptomyces sp. HNM0645 TaxID=2782343 RepID=UPI0024B703BF|nr:hypothetical protein [Streptomyces sp. HNM0645]MDI9888303.1 hypothetical protein [Streptomyces sp. HNM0645]